MPVKLRFSYGNIDEFPFSILELRAGALRGYGEGLRCHKMARHLLGRDPLELETLLPAPDSDKNRLALEPVSMALFDLAGKIKQVPLHALLGGKKADSVRLMPCVFPFDRQDAAEKATAFVKQGFTGLKVKLIGDLQEDLNIVQAIRHAVGQDIPLQGDANRGYKTHPEAIAAVEELGNAGLDIFEDPLLGNLDEYRQLRGRSRVKIMIDHFNRREDDYREALEKQACDIMNLHPIQPGGLGKAMAKVKAADQAGVAITVGGTGFTGFGTEAYHQLSAVACPGALCGEAGGFIDHGMPFSLVKRPVPIVNGSVLVSDAPGLGMELDEERLMSLKPDIITFP